MPTNNPSDLSVRDFNAQLSGLTKMSVKKWKVVKTTIATILIVAFAGFAIDQGADPTTTAWLALATAALINGIEFGELLAVWVEIHKQTDGKE